MAALGGEQHLGVDCLRSAEVVSLTVVESH